MERKGGRFQKRVHDVNGLDSFARTETSQHQQLTRRIDQNTNKKSKANAATPKMIPTPTIHQSGIYLLATL